VLDRANGRLGGWGDERGCGAPISADFRGQVHCLIDTGFVE
jgi:hypothetical protein